MNLVEFITVYAVWPDRGVRIFSSSLASRFSHLSIYTYSIHTFRSTPICWYSPACCARRLVTLTAVTCL